MKKRRGCRFDALGVFFVRLNAFLWPMKCMISALAVGNVLPNKRIVDITGKIIVVSQSVGECFECFGYRKVKLYIIACNLSCSHKKNQLKCFFYIFVVINSKLR